MFVFSHRLYKLLKNFRLKVASGWTLSLFHVFLGLALTPMLPYCVIYFHVLFLLTYGVLSRRTDFRNIFKLAKMRVRLELIVYSPCGVQILCGF